MTNVHALDQVLPRRRPLGHRDRAGAGAEDPRRHRREVAGPPGARLHGQAASPTASCDALAGRAAKGLQALGVGPGVHVGLYLPNTPHYVIAFFGVLKAGGTVVNYSPLDAARCSSTRSRTAAPTC